MITVAIGLGSNVDPEKNLAQAAVLLRKQWPHIRFSRVYRSAPQEIPDQQDFLNAVGTFETSQPLEDIFTVLQSIEQNLAKAPPYRFGPRTIDLDVLLYGERMALDPELTVPHPRMHRRRFVLEPLCELIDDQSLHPLLGESWKSLLQEIQYQPCELTPFTL